MAKPDQEWQNRAKGLLRAELAKRNIDYGELVERLAAIGVKESTTNISNKMNRGTFTFAFALQCLEAIGCRVLRLKDDD